MTPRLFDAVDRLRRPEYTGENRCVPCAAVNVAIALALAVVVGLVEPVAGGAVLVASLAAIALRGYLVPGTPTLTKRYVPDRVLAAFDKAPAGAGVAAPDSTAPDDQGDAGPLESADPETVLREHGLIEPRADADDLRLVPDVREAVRARIDGLRGGDRRRQVASFLEVDPDRVALAEHGSALVARVDGRPAGRWEGDAALLADLAGAAVLAERVPGWEAVGLETRSRLASGLRAFVETCPACEGPVSIDAETVESCCRSRQVYAVTCEDCDARVLEVTQ